MESTLTDTSVSSARALRITSAGHAAFAATMIALGIMGLIKGDFVQIWLPVPKGLPAHGALAYLSALISLAGGLGLLWRRAQTVASGVLFVALLLWVLTLRVPYLFLEKPLVLVAWSLGATSIMLAAAWALLVRFSGDKERRQLGFVADERGLRVARIIFGLSLIPFGLAHFMYLSATTVLIPGWLGWPTAWAYFTGAAFIAAGVAAVVDVFARLAISLTMLQLVLFSLIVWAPRMVAGTLTAFQRGEVITGFALTAAAWVIVESYRGRPWLALRRS